MTTVQRVQVLTEEVEATPKPSAHLDGVDGLRGLAALIIVVYHCFTMSHGPELRLIHHINVLRPLHDGWAGVDLFLVLSGFCLFWPYARSQARRMDVTDFMRRRIRRIVPAYYASLLFVPLAYLLSVRVLNLNVTPDDYSPFPHGLSDIFLHLSLLHSLTGATLQSWNTVTWSLGLEWTWYLVFPLAVWLYRHVGGTRAMLILSGVAIIYRLGLYGYFGPSSHFPANQIYYTDSLRTFVIGRLFEFGIGMYVAWWLASRKIKPITVKAALFLVPLLLIAGHVATPVDPFIPIRDVLYGSCFALLLFIIVAPHQSFVKRFISGRFLRSVGEYSYSLYLFHLPFAAAACAFLRQHGVMGAKTFFASLFILPLVLAFARLAYLAFEKPFMSVPTRKQYEQASPQEQPAA